MNDLKTKVDDLDVGVLKTVSIDLKYLLKQINKIQKKFGDLHKKNTKSKWFSEFKNEAQDTSSLVTNTLLNTKIVEVDNKTPDHAKYITVPEFNELTAENFKETLKQTDLLSENT